MRIGLNLQFFLLRTIFAAPVLGVAEEELLRGGVSALLLAQVEMFACGISEKRDVSQAKAAVIGSVFAQRELAIDMHAAGDGEVSVLLHFAVSLPFELLCVGCRPPFGKIARAVKFSALIVEAVRELVTYDAADVSVI